MASIQPSVAQQNGQRSVINLRPGFCDDLNAAAAGTREFGRIRILINLDLLNGGGGDADIPLFHAVDNQRDTTGSDGARIEKLRHGRDIVLVENRKVVEKAPV